MEGVVGVVDRPTVPVPLNADGTVPHRVILVVDLPKDAELDDSVAGAVPRLPDNEDRVAASETLTGPRRGPVHRLPQAEPHDRDVRLLFRRPHERAGHQGLDTYRAAGIPLKTVLELISPKTLRAYLDPEGAGAQPALGRTGLGRRVPPAEAAAIGTSVRSRAANLADVLDLSEIDALSEHIEAAGANAAAPDAAELKRLGDVEIEADIAAVLAEDPDGFSLTRLASAELATNARRLSALLDRLRVRTAGRGELDCDVAADWDPRPTFSQACTIAHGHILHFKQQWMADGYSLGDLLYSLPLAPCQKKQIAVIDWDRRESAARAESLEEREDLNAFLNRDRDISEIANAAVRESMAGGSEASAWSFGGGLGLGFIAGPVGGLLGVGGGVGGRLVGVAELGTRNASSDLAPAAARPHRARGVGGAQPALVGGADGPPGRDDAGRDRGGRQPQPLPRDHHRVLRGDAALPGAPLAGRRARVPAGAAADVALRRGEGAAVAGAADPLPARAAAAAGFDALQRIADNYVGSDMPVGAYAAEEIEDVDGYLRIQFRIQRPRDNKDGTVPRGGVGAAGAVLGINAQELARASLETSSSATASSRRCSGRASPRRSSTGCGSSSPSAAATRRPAARRDAGLGFSNDTPLYVSLQLAEPLSASAATG